MTFRRDLGLESDFKRVLISVGWPRERQKVNGASFWVIFDERISHGRKKKSSNVKKCDISCIQQSRYTSVFGASRPFRASYSLLSLLIP
jgi:hypothetical protein